MKKIKFIVLVFSIFLFNACENDTLTSIDAKVENSPSNNNVISSIMTNYENFIKSNFNRDLQFSPDFYEIRSDSGSHFFVTEFNDNLGLNEQYDIKNFLFYKPVTINDQVFETAFILRVIRKGSAHITEIVSPKNGSLIAERHTGITDKAYESLKISYDKNNFINNIVKCQSTCYTTFQACFDDLADGDGSPLDQAACDIVPCDIVAYVTCSFAELEGWIEDSDNFVGCENCDVLIGEQ